MKAIITPNGLAPITVEADNPRWQDDELGGWGEASFTATLDAYTKSKLYDATVQLVGPEPCYFGKVKGWQGDTITCVGWYDAFMRNAPRFAWYSHSNPSDWRECRLSGRNQSISMESDADGIRAVFPAATYALSSNTFVLPLDGRAAAVEVNFAWSRTDATNLDLKVMYGTLTTPGGNNGEDYTFSTIQDYGVIASTSGTCSLNASGNIDALAIQCKTLAHTYAADANVYISSLSVSTEGDATPVIEYVVGDILDALPASALPAGRDIATGLSSTLTGIVFGADRDEASKLEDLLRLGDWQFRFERRIKDGLFQPAAIFRARPTTSAYTFNGHSSEAEVNLTGGDITPLASRVRVMYRDGTGRTVYTDRTDTDTSHPLVALGVERWATITADTTVLAVAQAIGDAYLAQAGREQVKGSVTLTGPQNGISPSLIEAGRYCTITNTDKGTVTALIRHAEHEGANRVTLTLDNTPTLEELIRGARFNQSLADRWATVFRK